MKRKEGYTPKHHNEKAEIISWVKCIACALVIGLFLRFFVIEFVNVSGHSMEPGLTQNEIVLVEKVGRYFSLPEYGNVVIVKFSVVDDRYYVKRVIGLPGDTLSVTDGKVVRNGEVLDEPYLLEDTIFESMDEVTVPEGHIFVMGDNRNGSTDSRVVGAIPKKDIIGHGLCVIFPFSEIKTVK